jgi:Zn-dependent protease
MQEIAARIERHFRFSKKELFKLSMTALVAAFGLTISIGWGFFNIIEDNSVLGYVLNLIFVFVFVFFSLLVHISIQKIVALKLGYVAEYTNWLNGFIISTLFCFLSFGFLPLFFTGSVWCETEKKLRMGRFRYGVMHKDLGIISFAGPLTSMLLAGLLSPFYVATNSQMIFSIIVVNLLVAIFSLIPIPNFEKVRQIRGGTTGLYLFIASRWAFIFLFMLVLIYALLVFVAQIFSLVIAAIIAIIMAFLYYRTYEFSKF